MKRHDVLLLRSAGHKQREVAKFAGVSERSVRRIECEAPVADLDDQAAIRRRRVGRPSKASRFEEAVAKWLEAEPELRCSSCCAALEWTATREATAPSSIS